MSIFGNVARSVDAFRARREGRTMGEGAIGAALSLARTVALMRDQGEAPAAWALWAQCWCYFVAGLAVAGGLEGLAPWAVVALFRATYDRAQPYATRGEALNGAHAVALYAAGFSGALPRPYHDAAARVVDAWAGLVRAGLESAPCAWCEGPAPGGPGWAPAVGGTQRGAPGWSRPLWWSPAGAPAGGCCGTCGPECPAKSPGAGVEVWGLRYEQTGSALPSALVLYAVVPVGGGWALLEGEALGVPQTMESPADLLRAVCERNGWRCAGILTAAQVRAAESAEASKG